MKKIPVFIVALIVFAGLFWGLTVVGWTGTHEYTVSLPATVPAEGCKTGPVGSSKDVLDVVLCDPVLNEELAAFQKNAKYTGWHIAIKPEPEPNTWLVSLHSNGVIPGVSCQIKIEASGKKTILTPCQYQK